MCDSLNRVLGTLSDDTLVYCGHEYTQANLEFAGSVLSHEALARRIIDVTERRARGQFCASASMGIERATNPFLRCELAEMKEALGGATVLDAFAALRSRKDRA
jgi:hydroxyacylglutathione hydrolase